MSKVATWSGTMMIRAGTAGPSPPVGPKIGGMGLNIMNFCREFNARTENVLEGVPINTHITAYADKTYQLKIYSPVTSYFILRLAGLDRGSDKSPQMNVGQITLKEVYEVAKIKQQDPFMNHLPLKSICKSVIRCARTCGVVVVKERDPDFVPHPRIFPQL